MNRYRLLFSIILLLYFSPCLRAGEWQWSVTLDGFVLQRNEPESYGFLVDTRRLYAGESNSCRTTQYERRNSF